MIGAPRTTQASEQSEPRDGESTAARVSPNRVCAPAITLEAQLG